MNQKFPEWVKIGTVAMLALWAGCSLAALLIVSGRGEIGDKVGHFGDFFGCFNALVSVLGFSAVIYSLHKQEEDSVEETVRHRELIERQQEIFEQTAKLTLFDRRIAVYQAITQFCTAARDYYKLTPENLGAFLHSTKNSGFLFPSGSDAETFIEELLRKATMMEESIFPGVLLEPQIPNINEGKDDYVKWFKQQTPDKIYHLFHDYLRLPECRF
jgi:hypothetical protein